MSRRDYAFGVVAGMLIGFLALPVLDALGPAAFSRFAFVTVPVVFLVTALALVIVFSLSRKFPVLWQIGKFAVIGVMNMLVDWGVLTSLILLVRSHFGNGPDDFIIAGITFYSLFKASSFIIANINSYYWNKYWTFGPGAMKKTKTEFLQFFAVSTVGFVTNVFIASFVFGSVRPVHGLNRDQWGILGAAVGSAAGLIWNFLGYKFIVFKGRKPRSAEPQPVGAAKRSTHVP